MACRSWKPAGAIGAAVSGAVVVGWVCLALGRLSNEASNCGARAPGSRTGRMTRETRAKMPPRPRSIQTISGSLRLSPSMRGKLVRVLAFEEALGGSVARGTRGQSERWQSECVAASDGRFSLRFAVPVVVAAWSGPPPGPRIIVLAHAPGLMAVVGLAECDPRVSEIELPTIDLRPSWERRLLVRTMGGHAVGGADAVIEFRLVDRWREDASPVRLLLWHTTDEQGTAILEVPASDSPSARLSISDGVNAEWSRIVKMDEEVVIEAELERGCVVRGRLVGANTNPLGGVPVFVETHTHESLWELRARTRTEADGSFIVTGCGPRTARLLFGTDGRGRASPRLPGVSIDCDRKEGTALDVGVVREGDHDTIAGTLLASDGTAVSGAHVVLVGPGNSGIGVRTGSAGEFTFKAVLGGPYRIEVWDEDGRPRRLKARMEQVRPGEVNVKVDLAR